MSKAIISPSIINRAYIDKNRTGLYVPSKDNDKWELLSPKAVIAKVQYYEGGMALEKISS